jgi:isoleucyl-tRNA synthetase
MSKEKIKSVHLQDFPNVSSLRDSNVLMEEMDKVRDICSVALSIRDKKNLRVRLPLKSIKIVGRDIEGLKKYSDIILDEVNVKNIEFNENIEKLAEFKIQIDFRKVGSKLGSKMPEVVKASKTGNWKKVDDGKLEIAGEFLNSDEYEIKLQPKDSESTEAIKTNDAIVILDTKVTRELELEGLARDIVRLIQQNRREADLNVSDRIEIEIKTDSEELKEAIREHSIYICEQTLGKRLEVKKEISTKFSFKNELNENVVLVGFNVTNK